MPRLVNRLPKYRKHRATGQAVVTLAGRDLYLGPHGTKASRTEYDRLCGEFLASGGALRQDQRDQLTLDQLLAGFWTHAKQHYGKDSTEPQNYSTLIKRLRKAYGKTLVRDFGPLRLKAFRQSLVDEADEAGKAKLSRTTINHATNRLRRIFKWRIESELVRPDVLAALQCVVGLRYNKSGAKESEPIKPVPPASDDATLPHCSF